MSYFYLFHDVYISCFYIDIIVCGTVSAFHLQFEENSNDINYLNAYIVDETSIDDPVTLKFNENYVVEQPIIFPGRGRCGFVIKTSRFWWRILMICTLQNICSYFGFIN